MMAFEGTFVAEMRRRLEAEAAELERRLKESESRGLEAEARSGTGELSVLDNHPADIASETFERGKDLALLEGDELKLRRIREALQAMDEGVYGVCRTCGEPIPRERLEAVPETLYCVRHAPQRNEPERRPVEEEVLMPPFGRTSLDGHGSWSGFDGEDAWQIVESYGTSDSPALAENPGADDEQLAIEAEEHEGFVEPIESFLATDITGRHRTVVRGRAYDEYLEKGEGEPLLEPDPVVDIRLDGES
ncbi:MAG: molecular chaperone DnaK [Thermobacillus sp. ZCTH02-B1]|uniref:TraR/DksA C4-type zinc finger protein n=1 Tax=Thermobacillus sp. ZCTH02-B1 TaxID=1858795 RepID=UPI000B56E2C0|nr:TraR/DksA C4-type zinc finger protein [Thermobacillus sp. ZCTH02-B1]OUM95914.1 MAG: molecular chaperone DnaK [Thermobacillus sp. ZCTH02-B1]